MVPLPDLTGVPPASLAVVALHATTDGEGACRTRAEAQGLVSAGAGAGAGGWR